MNAKNVDHPGAWTTCRVSISVMIGAMIAHVPFIFALLILSLPGMPDKAFPNILILVVAVLAAIASGVAAFRWTYQRLEGATPSNGKKEDT